MFWVWYVATWLVVGVVAGVIVWRTAPGFLERRASRVNVLLPDDLRAEQLRRERTLSLVRTVAFVMVAAGAAACDIRFMAAPARLVLAMTCWGFLVLSGTVVAVAAVRLGRRGAVAHSRRWASAFLRPTRIASLCGAGIWPLVVISALVVAGQTPRPRQAMAALAIAALAGTAVAIVLAWARLPLRADSMLELGWADVRRAQEIHLLLAAPGLTVWFASMALLFPMVDAASSRNLGVFASMTTWLVTAVLSLYAFVAMDRRESQRWRALFAYPVTTAEAERAGREEPHVEAAS